MKEIDFREFSMPNRTSATPLFQRYLFHITMQQVHVQTYNLHIEPVEKA